jgi:hypothetical protein
MQVFVNISSRGLLLFRRTMSVSLHRLIRASMDSFPTVFAAPSWSREYPDTFLHSAEVVTCTHKRSMPCCTSEFDARPHFLCVGPSQWSEPITVPSRDLAYPPFCGSNFDLLPSSIYSLVVADLGILVLDNESPPPVFITHCGNTGLGTLPPLLPQSIIDRQNRGIIRGIPPTPKLRVGRQLLRNGASIDMQEGKETADPSVPFQILWLTVFYGTRITSDIGY